MSDNQQRAAAEVERATDQISRLSITDQNNANPHEKGLKEAIRNFEEAAVAFSEHGQRIIELLADDNLFLKEDTETVYAVHTMAPKLHSFAQSLRDSVVQVVAKYVTSLGDVRNRDVDELLKYLEKPIKSIASRVIGESKDENSLWKIAEECHNQAAGPAGELSPDDYLDSLGGDNDKSLLDHHALLRERLLEGRKKAAREDWIRFWTRSSNRCPRGPTMFQPLHEFHRFPMERPPKVIPRYLFRAFCADTKGVNNDDIIASWSIRHDISDHHKKDLLSLNREDASAILHGHLESFRSNEKDNLVSWSSSLMFLVQYENWEFCNWSYAPQDRIYIHAVDTTKFPHGQFVRDKWLLRQFRDTQAAKEADRTIPCTSNAGLMIFLDIPAAGSQ
ncbi:hypothetical protein NW761_004879 [Fusarium oxysporum]|nr:hypothetical protein NW758_003147 [Fusarium oxysporum]KAJ4087057.1 hypothetical protein NW769_013890 [Fusarium oxysporum]KAJ4096912.1 hypothetical protein NW761_004879 [Fusarium oxysporum]KAJ4239209.1 hypothetical protein NW760_002962 [Fusarium oxysporum]WKT45489.1 hypothetical protein QSH57_010363 [Fusarium oxysporum f. sp. vasinfectum]